MANTKPINDVENLVKKILSDRAAETAGLKEQLSIEEANRAKASVAAEKAAQKGDVEAYKKARADLLDALNAGDLYATRLEKLEEQPLISKADYEAAVKTIYGCISALDYQIRQKLKKLSDQMQAEVGELQEAASYANETLRRLQHDVYRDADRRRDPHGDVIEIRQEAKHVDPWETISWGLAGVEHYQYKMFTGRKEQ